MTDVASTLPLAASLTLLLTKDDGRFAVDTTGLDLSLAGAVIADLAIHRYITLADKRVLPHRTANVPADPILADTFARIRTEPTPRSASWWVSKIQGRELRLSLLSSLVASGTLQRVDRKVLGLFPASAYPEVDGSTERAVRDQLSAVLVGTTPPTPASAALIALLSTTTALRKQFGSVPKDRVKALTDGDWAAPAVKAVMAEIAAVATITVTLASATATINS